MTQATERPILFSAPMVRAILDGRKTQTRRIVKPAVAEAIEFIAGRCDGDPTTKDDFYIEWLSCEDDGKKMREQWCLSSMEYPEEGCVPIGKAYGRLGDRLWVRETFQPLFADGVSYSEADWETGHGYKIGYVATDGRQEWIDPDDEWTDRCTPAIHMPRWASRITLEVTGVRIERLQDISEADALAEGIQHSTMNDPRVEYQWLWEQINGAGSWNANPWVWVIEFKRAGPREESGL